MTLVRAVVSSLLPLLPTVRKPDRRIPFPEKMQWTVLTLLLYCTCSNLPLFGIQQFSTSDPYYWMRIILASNRGTLMELGVSPLITSGLILQLLAGARLLNLNLDDSNKRDRHLFTAYQKLLAMIITLVQATAYVYSGMYGPLTAIGYGNATLIIVQLFCSGLLVLTLDEFLQAGYGLGPSALTLIIASHICESVVWSAFSPTTITTVRGTEFYGAVLALFHLVVVRNNKVEAVRSALYRQNLPNLTNLMATVLIFLVCIYFQGWKVTIPVKYQKYRGQEGKFPIKLFYTGNMPIVLLTAAISNLYFTSQLLFAKDPNNALVRLLGVWESSAVGGDIASGGTTTSVPVSGLAYYMSPPRSMTEIIYDPFHALFYLLFTLTACAIFSRAWTEVSGTTARDEARKMQSQQIVMKGHRDFATHNVLRRYIPTAAALGGICIGLLSVLADFLGAIGSGTGILLAVTIIYEFYEAYARETMGGAGMNLAALGLA